MKGKQMKSASANPKNRTSWNNQANRYQSQARFSFDIIDYGDADCDTESELNLIGNPAGLRVLEIGCGGANCGIALAKQGGMVTCLDFSSEQLRHAKENAVREDVDIVFFESEIEKIGELNIDTQFDLVISICALQYVSDIKAVFSQVYDCLHSGGMFVFSLDNPIFYSIANELLWKENPVDNGYFLRGAETWKWDDTDAFEFTTYRRPISDYVNMLIETGFRLERFHEMSPGYVNPVTEEQKLEQRYPRYMVFKATKL